MNRIVLEQEFYELSILSADALELGFMDYFNEFSKRMAAIGRELQQPA